MSQISTNYHKGQGSDAILALRAEPSTRLVGIYLVNRADEAGACYPSIPTIADALDLSHRTVQRALRHLAREGMIKVTPRVDQSSVFTLTRVVTPMTPGDTHVTPVVTPMTRSGDTHVTQNDTGKLLNELHISARGAANLLWNALVETFWKDQSTNGDEKRIGGLARDLKAKGATPDEIHRRAGHLRGWLGEGDFTPEALRKHWAKLAKPQRPIQEKNHAGVVQPKPGKFPGFKTANDPAAA